MRTAATSSYSAPSVHRTKCWIFDLDNTLYPAECGILDAMHVRSAQFIQQLLGVDREEAMALRRSYQERYGTALRGLSLHHGVGHEAFIDYVHRVDLACLDALPSLADAIGSLPGRRIVHTNAPRRHAEAVIGRLGLASVIDGIFDIAASNFVPKPNLQSYEAFIRAFGIDPAQSCMFEDQDRNLEYPAQLGMRTVLVTSGEIARLRPDHVHEQTSDLRRFLCSLAGEARGRPS